MLVQDHIGALTAMYDRMVLGTRLMPDMPKRQDYALWLSIMRDGHPARGLPEPLAVYRAGRRCLRIGSAGRFPELSCRCCGAVRWSNDRPQVHSAWSGYARIGGWLGCVCGQ
jgi:hypothetical protein